MYSSSHFPQAPQRTKFSCYSAQQNELYIWREIKGHINFTEFSQENKKKKIISQRFLEGMYNYFVKVTFLTESLQTSDSISSYFPQI